MRRRADHDWKKSRMIATVSRPSRRESCPPFCLVAAVRRTPGMRARTQGRTGKMRGHICTRAGPGHHGAERVPRAWDGTTFCALEPGRANTMEGGVQHFSPPQRTIPANAGDPPRWALTAATTAPSPAQASGRTPRHPVRPRDGPHTTHTWRDSAKSDRFRGLNFLVVSQHVPPDARGPGATSWPESAPLGGFDERHQGTGPVGGLWCTLIWT